MTVSIALCTYNGERFLPMQLESYVKQSKLPDELVVCDDGSTDGTIDILYQFQESAPFTVRIFRNENRLGHAKNFMQCMQKCVGDIILFSDQDDVWFPQKVNKFCEAFESDPLYRLVFSNAELIDEDGNIIVRDYFGVTDFYYRWDVFKPLSKVMAKNYGFVNGFLIGVNRRFVNDLLSFFDEFPNYELPMGHDHFIAIMAGLLYEPYFIKELPYVLVQYRQHDSQVIGATYSSKEQLSFQQKLAKKRKEKQEHIISFTSYLEKYKAIVDLTAKDNKMSELLAKSIHFQQGRIKNSATSFLSRIFFVGIDFIGGRYHKYTQNAFKEAFRDIL